MKKSLQFTLEQKATNLINKNKNMVKLTHKAKEELKSTDVQMRIALDCGKTLQTVANWIKHEHEYLSLKNTVRSILTHTNLKENEIFN